MNSGATSVTRLRLHRSAVVGLFVLWREIYHRAILDFCNTIGTSRHSGTADHGWICIPLSHSGLRSESLGAVAAVWRPQADMGQTQASMRIAPHLLAKLVALDLAGRRSRQIVGHFEPPRPLVRR